MYPEETPEDVLEELKEMSIGTFVFNLDRNLAKFLDLTLTHYNDTRKGHKGESEEEWEEILLGLRDTFRKYHKHKDQPEWDEELQKEIEEAFVLLGQIYTGLWQ